jgi:hypothetical protein
MGLDRPSTSNTLQVQTVSLHSLRLQRDFCYPVYYSKLRGIGYNTSTHTHSHKLFRCSGNCKANNYDIFHKKLPIYCIFYCNVESSTIDSNFKSLFYSTVQTYTRCVTYGKMIISIPCFHVQSELNTLFLIAQSPITNSISAQYPNCLMSHSYFLSSPNIITIIMLYLGG